MARDDIVGSDYFDSREVPAMMPGQDPYTPTEYAAVVKLVRDAADGDPGEQDED